MLIYFWLFIFMMNVHLVVCGTSVVENYKRSSGVSDDDKRICDDDVELFRRATPADWFFLRVYEFVRVDPFRASAELNSMRKFLEAKAVDEVYLYYTDTGKGVFCAKVIEKFLVDCYGLRCSSIKVEGFGVKGFFEDGLINLLDKLMGKIGELHRAGVNVYLNATGGFKPENAIAVLAASLLNVKNIYYIHERFQDVEMIPIFPISITSDYVKPLKKLYDDYRLHGFTPKGEFEKIYGMDMIEDLKDRNLIKEEDGRLVLRKWTVTILKYAL